MPQFSLRSLFTLTAAIALFAALSQAFHWSRKVITDATLLSAAILLIVNGKLARSSKMVALGGVLLLLAGVFWWHGLMQVAVGHGHRVVVVTVEVLDKSSGKPINGAEVWLHYGESPSSTPSDNVVKTDPSGRAKLEVDINTSTKANAYSRTKYFAFQFDTLFAHAAGYKPLQRPVHAYMNPKTLCSNLPIKPVKVYLDPLQAAATE